MKQLHTIYTKTTQVFKINALTNSYGIGVGVGLDLFIQQCYNLPKPFEINECSNDSYHRIEVDTEPLGDYDLEVANEAIANGSCTIYQLKDVMREMCCYGLIDPGIYLVKMSW